MNYKITFRDKHEISIDLDDSEVSKLSSEKGTMFESDGNYYNTSDIVRIEKDSSVPMSEGYLEEKRLATQKRLSAATNNGFDKIETTGYMERLFDSMKEHGHFKNYANYESWQAQQE